MDLLKKLGSLAMTHLRPPSMYKYETYPGQPLLSPQTNNLENPDHPLHSILYTFDNPNT